MANVEELSVLLDQRLSMNGYLTWKKANNRVSPSRGFRKKMSLGMRRYCDTNQAYLSLFLFFLLVQKTPVNFHEMRRHVPRGIPKIFNEH